jgi:uncharacterized SAM-binding protein YcdF (DUF218 family)
VEYVSMLVVPSGLAYLLFLTGLVARFIPRTRGWSWALLASGALITLTFSLGQTAAALSSPLEYRWPAVRDAQAHREARSIVVLSAWAADDPALPVTGQLNASAAYRVLMALELHRQRPELDIIVSGGDVTARVMGAALTAAGVPAERVRLETRSRTTAESAEQLAPLVGDAPFLLVTSAGHMHRSLAALERRGLRAIPAPTDHQMPRDWREAELVPRPGSLQSSDLAVHEYLGMLWYRLRGRA